MKVARVQSLDILRGVAILMVIIHHAGEEMIPAQPEVSGAIGFAFWSLKNLGWSGVDLFFVLSGYLIGGLLFSEIERSGSLRCGRFWLRRGFKIWPSYFALLLVLALAPATRWIDLGSLSAGLNDLLVHGLFLQNYLDRGVNGPTWSLAVEEHFYILLPLMLLSLRLLRKGEQLAPRVYHAFFALSLGGGLALRCWYAMQGGPRVDDFMLTHFRFDSLLWGVALQYYSRAHGARLGELARRYRWPLMVVAALLLLPTLFVSRNEAAMFSVGFTGLALGYAIILWLIVSAGEPPRRLQPLLKPVATVGTWSYNIYLWHFFAPLLLPGYDPLQVMIGQSGLPSLAILVAQVLVYAALSIAVGGLMTRVVEIPFLGLRERWVPGGKRPPSVVAASLGSGSKH